MHSDGPVTQLFSPEMPQLETPVLDNSSTCSVRVQCNLKHRIALHHEASALSIQRHIPVAKHQHNPILGMTCEFHIHVCRRSHSFEILMRNVWRYKSLDMTAKGLQIISHITLGYDFQQFVFHAQAVLILVLVLVQKPWLFLIFKRANTSL